MKNTALLWMLLAPLTAFSASPLILGTPEPHAAAPDARPYGLNPLLDIPLAGGLWAANAHAGARLKKTREVPLNMSRLDRREIPAYDRWAIGFHSSALSGLSSGLAWSQLLIPAAVNVWDTRSGLQPWYGAITDAVILQEALLLSSTLSSYAKSFPIHSTPLTYDPAVGEGEKRVPQNVSSFFSNHTASAFTTAVFTGYTFQLKHPESPLVPWIWGTSLTMATGVGALRVMSGKHFPTDVLAGAAVGALSGYLVPRLHLRLAARRNLASAHAEKAGAAKGKRKLDVDVGLTFPGGSTTPVPTLNIGF
jgi:membrane-associated phospholipid phosphatase